LLLGYYDVLYLVYFAKLKGKPEAID
jgi:hypothetical protein